MRVASRLLLLLILYMAARSRSFWRCKTIPACVDWKRESGRPNVTWDATADFSRAPTWVPRVGSSALCFFSRCFFSRYLLPLTCDVCSVGRSVRASCGCDGSYPPHVSALMESSAIASTPPVASGKRERSARCCRSASAVLADAVAAGHPRGIPAHTAGEQARGRPGAADAASATHPDSRGEGGMALIGTVVTDDTHITRPSSLADRHAGRHVDRHATRILRHNFDDPPVTLRSSPRDARRDAFGALCGVVRSCVPLQSGSVSPADADGADARMGAARIPGAGPRGLMGRFKESVRACVGKSATLDRACSRSTSSRTSCHVRSMTASCTSLRVAA